MKLIPWLSVAVLTVVLAGCQKLEGPRTAAPKKVDEAEVQANLAKLSPEDQKLAEEQRFCAVLKDSRLGSMGVPVKITVKDEPVFLCCKGCTKKARSNPDQTLAKAKELKAKNAPTPE
jgi:hypothetical protein